jgi:ligand-binding sensor domain-containing protein
MNIFKSFLLISTLNFSCVVNAQEWIPHQSPQKINDIVDKGSEFIMATDYGIVTINKNTLIKNALNNQNSKLTNNHISAITKSPSGDIYFSTDQTIGKLEGSDITEINIPAALKTNINTLLFFDIEVASNGDIWVGSSEGILHKKGLNWSKYGKTDLGDFFRVWDIEINNVGDVFAGAENGVHKFENGMWSHISKNDSLQGYRNAELFISKSGDLFFGGDLTKTARYDGVKWEVYNKGSGTDRMQFTEDKDSNIYMSANGMVWLLNNNKNTWNTYTDSQTLAMDDLLSNEDSYYYIDTQNQRWFCKNIYLSVSYNGTIRSTSISSNTLEANSIKGIHNGRNGKLFFTMGRSATWSIAVVDIEGNWSTLELPDSLKWNLGINDILFLAEDDIYLTSYEGLTHYDGKKWSTNKMVFNGKQLATNSQGKIYVLASKRIYIIENGNISEYTPNNSPLSDLEATSGLGIDAKDNLWIASFDWSGNSKIQKMDADGKWTTFDQTNHPSIDQPAGDFHFDKNGNIWISAKVGAIKYDGQKFSNPIKENISNLENYKASSIESDSEGRIYFAHQYGVTTLLDSVWGELLIDNVPNKKTSATTILKFDNNGTLWWASNIYGLYSYTKSSSTSIFSNYDLTPNISIYPNPSTGLLNFKNIYMNEASIYIYTTQGKLVYSNDELIPNSPIQLNQAPGMYFVVIKNSRSTYTQKLILK